MTSTVHPAGNAAGNAAGTDESGNLFRLDLARQIIKDRYGFRVSDSWLGQLAARLTARASATGKASVDEYLFWLQSSESSAAELAIFAEGILNGETHFLRTEPHFNALLEKIVPAWRDERVPGQRLRIASLGCSTGEEPYSIALVLRERLSPETMADIEITGVDVSGKSLASARAGLYEEFQLREVSPARRHRWFRREGTKLSVHPDLRASVRFLQHNLLDPLPFAGLDVIFCRNVLIYFSASRVAACLVEFHSALKPGGFLFLGHSESAFAFPTLFEPTPVRDSVIYQKRNVSPVLS